MLIRIGVCGIVEIILGIEHVTHFLPFIFCALESSEVIVLYREFIRERSRQSCELRSLTDWCVELVKVVTWNAFMLVESQSSDYTHATARHGYTECFSIATAVVKRSTGRFTLW